MGSNIRMPFWLPPNPSTLLPSGKIVISETSSHVPTSCCFTFSVCCCAFPRLDRSNANASPINATSAILYIILMLVPSGCLDDYLSDDNLVRLNIDTQQPERRLTVSKCTHARPGVCGHAKYAACCSEYSIVSRQIHLVGTREFWPARHPFWSTVS